MTTINDNIFKNFLNNLHNQGKSKVSIKNYKSDMGHFLAWAVLKLKSFGSYAESLTEILPFIDHKFFDEYKRYMIENKLKLKTINRRLSTLRNFSSFLYSANLIGQDFMNGIQNMGIGTHDFVREKEQEILVKFRESLEKNNKASANTVKNYVSDVKNFLAWLNENEHNTEGSLPREASKLKGELPNEV